MTGFILKFHFILLTMLIVSACGTGFELNVTSLSSETKKTEVGKLFCGDTPSGDKESRVMFKSLTVSSGAQCIQEIQTRTCNDGSFSEWTGSYTNETCTITQSQKCNGTNNGDKETRVRYKSSSVPFGSTCQRETQSRTCSNGAFSSWTGSYANVTCTVEQPKMCNGVNDGDKETRLRYKSSSVPFGSTCQKQIQSRNCNNGNFLDWTGDYQYSACEISKEVVVYVLAGQSNMSGYARVSKLSESLTQIPSNVVYYDREVKVNKFSDRFIDGINVFGPEVSLAHKLSKKYPDKLIYIYKYAVGGTTIMEWCPDCDEPAALSRTDYVKNKGTHYRGLVSTFEEVIEKDRTLKESEFIVKAVAWMQGESDAIGGGDITFPYTYTLYLNNFKKVIHNFRKDFGEGTPFVFGRIWDYPEGTYLLGKREHVTFVRKAQEDVLSEFNSDLNQQYIQMINTDSFNLADIYHFNYNGQLKLGECFFESLEAKQDLIINNCPQ